MRLRRALAMGEMAKQCSALMNEGPVKLRRQWLPLFFSFFFLDIRAVYCVCCPRDKNKLQSNGHVFVFIFFFLFKFRQRQQEREF